MELSIEQITRIYNIGYNCGHFDTESGFECPAHETEIDFHQREAVEKILKDIDNV
jgi:hypothetical protein